MRCFYHWKFNFASEQSQFQSVGVAPTEFYSFELFSFWVLKKVVLKLQKFCWRNIFIIEMFIFGNFVQKVDFEPSHLQKLRVVLAEFYLFELPSLWLLRQSCFKTPKFVLYECLYHWNIHFWFAIFVKKVNFGLSHLQKLNVVLAEFYSFQLPWLRLLRENCFKVLRLTWDEYFYHLNVYFC